MILSVSQSAVGPEAAQNITSKLVGMKAAFMDLTDMEAYRENIVAHKDKLNNRYEQQARQMKQEYQAKIEALEEALQAKSREVTGEDEILANIDAGMMEAEADEEDEEDYEDDEDEDEEGINFKPPALLETDVSEENLLGLYLIFPIEHIETNEPPPGNECHTVCYPTTDELINHGGNHYTSLDGVDTGDAIITCIRTGSNSNVKVLLHHPNATTSYIITCQPLTHREGDRRKYKEISRFQVQYSDYSHFVVLDDMIYLTQWNNNAIHFFNSNGDPLGELIHDNIKFPYGICTNGIEVFVGCKDSIWGFKPDNPEETLRKICDVAGCDYGIPGICYHQQHIYVKPDLGTEIFIYNSESGEKVVELKLSVGPSVTHDMQIHPDGRLVLAGDTQGAFYYRLNCN